MAWRRSARGYSPPLRPSACYQRGEGGVAAGDCRELHEMDAGRAWPQGREAAIDEDHVLAVPGEGAGDGQRPAQMAAASRLWTQKSRSCGAMECWPRRRDGQPRQTEQERALGVVADGRLALMSSRAEDGAASRMPLWATTRRGPSSRASHQGSRRGEGPPRAALTNRAGGSRGPGLGIGEPGTEPARRSARRRTSRRPALSFRRGSVAGSGKHRRGPSPGAASGLVMQGAAAKPSGSPAATGSGPCTQRMSAGLSAAISFQAVLAWDQAETHSVLAMVAPRLPRAQPAAPLPQAGVARLDPGAGHIAQRRRSSADPGGHRRAEQRTPRGRVVRTHGVVPSSTMSATPPRGRPGPAARQPAPQEWPCVCLGDGRQT